MKKDRKLFFQGVVALLVTTPALALGSVHPTVLAFYLIAASVLLFDIAFSRRSPIRPQLDLPGALLAALAVFTLVQLIPLPSVVVKLLSPEAYEIRARAFRPLGEQAPAMMPLTLDSTLTAAEFGKLILYLVVYWSCSSWTRRYGSRYALGLVSIAGAAMVAAILIHRILLWDKVWGFYAPIHLPIGVASVSSPLVNANHLAAFLGICTTVTIGEALRTKARSRRALLICLAALMGGALFTTLSRGGIAAFVGGQFLFIALRIVHRTAKGAGRAGYAHHIAWLPLGLALSVGLGLFAVEDALRQEIAKNDTGKIGLILQGLPLIGKFPLTGAGRGAFWVGFPLVSELTASTTYTHAENAIVQLLVDWGVIVGGSALVGFCFIAIRILRNAPERPHYAAALAALVAFGLHNLVDFNMEIPGVAVLAAALLGTLQARQPPVVLRTAIHIPKLALVGTAAAGVAVACFLGLYAADRSLDSEERIYKQALENRDKEPFSRDELKSVLSRHPADWYIPFIVGARSYHTGQGNPLPWLARALELNPSSASAHLYVGRTLLRIRRIDQAMLELRLAARGNPAFAAACAEMLVAVRPSFEELSKIAVTRDDKLLLWPALARFLAEKGHASEAEAADIAILSIDPFETTSLARHARRLTERERFDDALKLAEKLGGVTGYGPAGAILKAEILERNSKPEAAAVVLDQGSALFPENPDLLYALARAKQRSGDHKGAVDAAVKLRALATSSYSLASAVLLEAELEMAEGRVNTALARYRQAYAIDPANTGVLERMAEISEQQGDLTRAVEALRQLCRDDSENRNCGDKLRVLEEKAKVGGYLPK